MKIKWNRYFVSLCICVSIFFVENGMVFADSLQENQGNMTRNCVVVLDPGHGGADGGASRTINGTTYCERNLNLKIANYCKEELEKNNGITVYMTRTDNSSECKDRKWRADYAQQVYADMLVSLHVNATAEETTITYSGASIYYPNGNYNRELSENGKLLSNYIMNELVALGLHNDGVVTKDSDDGSTYPDGSVTDYLGINQWCKLDGITGILVEHAYLNNVSDVNGFLSSEEKLKQLGIADAKGIMNCINSGKFVMNKSARGQWQFDGTGWWFAYEQGGYPVNKFELINGKYYYFNSNGYICTGWNYIGNNWYCFDESGAMIVGWVNSYGTWYYMNTDGTMATGWVNSYGTWYYMSADGAMATGWVNDNGNWYYLQGNGAMTNGWINSYGTWYYMKDSGAMNTGWINLYGTWYYMNAGGAMCTGWIYDGSNWYYMKDSGAMATGWNYINGSWYYMAGDGNMQTDAWIDGYYVNAYGVCQ